MLQTKILLLIILNQLIIIMFKHVAVCGVKDNPKATNIRKPIIPQLQFAHGITHSRSIPQLRSRPPPHELTWIWTDNRAPKKNIIAYALLLAHFLRRRVLAFFCGRMCVSVVPVFCTHPGAPRFPRNRCAVESASARVAARWRGSLNIICIFAAAVVFVFAHANARVWAHV